MTTPFYIKFPESSQFPYAGPVSFASLGLAKPSLSIASQKESTFKFTADGAAADSDALASEGQIVTVYTSPDGVAFTPFFCGRLFRVPRRGAPGSESIEYQIVDSWYDLKRIVYQQKWNCMTARAEDGTPTTAIQYCSELILGMANPTDPFLHLNSGGVIADAITWAHNCGANVQLGTIGVAAPIPMDKATDLPVSEVIRKMLRWSPDAVAWFDYTTTPPTFNVTRRGGCRQLNLAFADSPVAQQEIEALPDLQVPGVTINYLQTNSSNIGPSTLTITEDVAGADNTTFGAAVMTCRLSGAVSKYQRQKVTVAQFPHASSAGGEGGPANDKTIQWWQRKVPWLSNLGTPGTFTASDIGNQLVITNVYSRYQVGQGDDDGTGNIPVDYDQYPNELLTGALTGWMTGIQWAKCNILATIKYSYPANQADYSAQDWEATKIWGSDDGSGFSPAINNVSAVATLTNAVSTTYSQLTSFTNAEPLPVGLAAYIYSCLAQLQYKGSYTSVADEVATASLGIVLNLTGGRAEWTGMNALVQQIDQDLEKGSTKLTFGPAEHLSLADLMEQLRASRTRVESEAINERKTGETANDGTPIDGPVQGASDGGGMGRDNQRYPWIGDQIDDDAGDGENTPPYDALLGYGSSSFAGSGGIVQPCPLQKLEIDVGNTGDGFSDGAYASTSAKNAFSLISGDDTEHNDQLLIGRTNGGGSNGGSIILTPYDDAGAVAPSIVLSPNLDGSIDSTDDSGSDQYIRLTLDGPLVDVYSSDGSGSFARMDLGAKQIILGNNGGSYLALDLSGDPILNISNADTGGYSSLDENSVNLLDGESGTAVSIDASAIGDGNTYSLHPVTICNPDGSNSTITVYVVGKDSDFS